MGQLRKNNKKRRCTPCSTTLDACRRWRFQWQANVPSICGEWRVSQKRKRANVKISRRLPPPLPSPSLLVHALRTKIPPAAWCAGFDDSFYARTQYMVGDGMRRAGSRIGRASHVRHLIRQWWRQSLGSFGRKTKKDADPSARHWMCVDVGAFNDKLIDSKP